MKSWVGREKYIHMYILMYIDEILELMKPTFQWETETNKQPEAPRQCANDACYIQKQSRGVTGLHQHGDQGRLLIHRIEIYENKYLK